VVVVALGATAAALAAAAVAKNASGLWKIIHYIASAVQELYYCTSSELWELFGLR